MTRSGSSKRWGHAIACAPTTRIIGVWIKRPRSNVRFLIVIPPENPDGDREERVAEEALGLFAVLGSRVHGAQARRVAFRNSTRYDAKLKFTIKQKTVRLDSRRTEKSRRSHERRVRKLARNSS